MSFADLELLRQGVRLEPLLQAICDFLDKQPALIERVRRDLVRGLKQPDHGRRGLTASQVLRALVLMRVKNWDYRELRERIVDGITLRAFTDFYCEEVPKHDAFNRSFNRLTPATLKAVNDLVVEAAVKLGLEDGRKLRVETAARRGKSPAGAGPSPSRRRRMAGGFVRPFHTLAQFEDAFACAGAFVTRTMRSIGCRGSAH
jgi:IS5 family transposase